MHDVLKMSVSSQVSKYDPEAQVAPSAGMKWCYIAQGHSHMANWDEMLKN